MELKLSQSRRTAFPTVVIYGLVDPRDNQLRYVGKAANVNVRFETHLVECKQGGTHKNHWLMSLVRKGLRPYLIVLEEVCVCDWQSEEIWWVSYTRSLGARLTNGTSGGEGFTGRHTEESRKKMSESHQNQIFTNEQRAGISAYHKGRAKSEEHKRKISEALKGKKRSPEHCANISVAVTGEKNHWFGRKHSEETKQKIASALTGHEVSDETRQKLSERNTGYKFTEEQLKRTAEGKARRQVRII